MSRRVLVVGHSHIVALQQGHAFLQAHNEAALAGFEFRFLNLLTPKVLFTAPPDEDPALLPEEYSGVFRDFRPDITVLVIRGNEHNMFGLVDHRVRYDFVYPFRPELPTDHRRGIVPYNALEKAMRVPMEWARRLTSATRHLETGRLLSIESPPPIPDETHIRANARTLSSMIERFGVAPVTLRYKTWMAHSRIQREMCREFGIEFVPIPRGVLDESGLLVKRAWAEDATHANQWYGRMVLHQVMRLAERAPAKKETTS